MKIRTKVFWTFQLAVAFVSAVIQIIFWYVTGFIISEPTDLFAGLLFSICSVIAFAITLFPVWKLWHGKSWLSLSLLFFCAITIIAAVLFILSNIVVGDAAFVIAWIGIIHYILGAPANLVNAVAIGLIGKYFVNRFSTDINQDWQWHWKARIIWFFRLQFRL